MDESPHVDLKNLKKNVKKNLLPLLLFLGFSFLYVLPIFLNYYQKNQIWIDGYIPAYFGQFDQHFPLFSSWWRNLSIGEYPFLFNILVFLPFKIFNIFFDGYVSWIIYIQFLFFSSYLTFYLFIKELFPDTSLKKAAAMGLLYGGYISINQEVYYFTLKTASAFLPLALLILIKFFKVDIHKVNKNLLFFYLLLFSVLILNFVILDPRSIVSFSFISFAIFVYFYFTTKKIKKIFQAFGFFLTGIILALILYFPIKFPEQISYLFTGQLPIQIASSIVLPSSNFLKIIFQPNPNLNFSTNAIFIITFIICFLITTFAYNVSKSKLLCIPILILISAYVLFTNQNILTFLTLNLPLGQLFRTWEISQYISAFIIPLLFLSAVQIKKVRFLSYFLIITYLLLSFLIFKNQLIFINNKNLDPYRQVNSYLSDDGHPKVLWTPEMGWLGRNVIPFWLDNHNSSAQAFPEFVSALPTYLHYFTPMTQVYTWLASGNWSSQLETNKNVAQLLNILGIKYVVIHTDVSGYNNGARQQIDNLKKSTDFKLLKKFSYIDVFENKKFIDSFWTTPLKNSFFCDSGFKCISDFYYNHSTYSSTSFLTDQTSSIVYENKINKIYSSSKSEEKYYNLLINNLMNDSKKDSLLLFSSDYTKYQKDVACTSDTHQGVYHDNFLSNQTYDYGEPFSFQKCFFKLSNFSSLINLPIQLKKGNYTLLIRYMKQIGGGGFVIKSDGFNFYYPTSSKDNLNYYTYDKQSINIKGDEEGYLNLINYGGTNFISVIALIPTQKYQQQLWKIKRLTVIGEDHMDKNDGTRLYNLHEINTSKWEADIKTKEPQIFNYASAYNPYWKIEVYKNGKKVEEEYSSAGYGIINSFPITQIGNLHIKLIYYPQEVYERDFAISMGVILLFSIIFILYFKRNEKNNNK